MFGLFKKKREYPLYAVGLAQAGLLTLYSWLVSMIMFNGNRWFGPMTGPIGPVLFLLLFITSALISLFIVFWYPFQLFWFKKQPQNALMVLGYTTLWLFIFTIICIFYLLLT